MTTPPKTLKLEGAALKAAKQIKALHDSMDTKMKEIEADYQSSVKHLNETLGSVINQRFVDLFEYLGMLPHEVNNYLLDTTYLEAHGDMFLKRQEPQQQVVTNLGDLLASAASTKH